MPLYHTPFEKSSRFFPTRNFPKVAKVRRKPTLSSYAEFLLIMYTCIQNRSGYIPPTKAIPVEDMTPPDLPAAEKWPVTTFSFFYPDSYSFIFSFSFTYSFSCCAKMFPHIGSLDRQIWDVRNGKTPANKGFLWFSHCGKRQERKKQILEREENISNYFVVICANSALRIRCIFFSRRYPAGCWSIPWSYALLFLSFCAIVPWITVNLCKLWKRLWNTCVNGCITCGKPSTSCG